MVEVVGFINRGVLAMKRVSKIENVISYRLKLHNKIYAKMANDQLNYSGYDRVYLFQLSARRLLTSSRRRRPPEGCAIILTDISVLLIIVSNKRSSSSYVSYTTCSRQLINDGLTDGRTDGRLDCLSNSKMRGGQKPNRFFNPT